MTPAKTVLIVGGVGLGAFLIYKLVSKPSAPTQMTSAGTLIQNLGNVPGQLFSALFGSSSTSGPNSYGQFAGNGGISQATLDANGGNPYYVTTGSGSYSAGAAANYEYADSHPGTALPEGVYGPPVPTGADLYPGSSTGFSDPEWV